MQNVRRCLILMLICFLLQSCMSARVSQELQLGKMTFESGDYKLAFHELLPLAVDGNAEAQYAIGYMYYYGYGTSQDEIVGIFWMNKAAAQCYAPAIDALERIHQENIKVHLPPHHPIFQNGVPRVISGQAKSTLDMSHNVKVITRTDLPVLKNQNVIVPIDLSQKELPKKKIARQENNHLDTGLSAKGKVSDVKGVPIIPRNEQTNKVELFELPKDPFIVYGLYSSYYPLKPMIQQVVISYSQPSQTFTPWVRSVLV